MTNNAAGQTVSPFACDLGAIAPEEGPQHLSIARKLFQSVKQIEELENGYRFVFHENANTLKDAAEFIDRERLCCPFFGFGLEVGAERAEVSLQLTGREGVKAFIQAEISEFLGQDTTFQQKLYQLQ